VTNGWSDGSFKDLLALHKDLLPQGNVVPATVYEAKQIIYPLCLEVEKIHACKNDCILYHGAEYEDLEKCPLYGLDRFNHRKAAVMMRIATEENLGLKGVLVLSYHSSFEALVCKQKVVRIVMMAQSEA
jgi:hypothetical protein